MQSFKKHLKEDFVFEFTQELSKVQKKIHQNNPRAVTDRQFGIELEFSTRQKWNVGKEQTEDDKWIGLAKTFYDEMDYLIDLIGDLMPDSMDINTYLTSAQKSLGQDLYPYYNYEHRTPLWNIWVDVMFDVLEELFTDSKFFTSVFKIKNRTKANAIMKILYDKLVPKRKKYKYDAPKALKKDQPFIDLAIEKLDFDLDKIEDTFRSILQTNKFVRFVTQHGGEASFDGYYDEENQAQQFADNNLQIKWSVEFDETPAIEFVSPPLKRKDLPKLLQDMRLLSQFKTSNNTSAHIHIEKMKNFSYFNYIALMCLVDEESFHSDQNRIGKGRKNTVKGWAASVKPVVYDETVYSMFENRNITDNYTSISMSKIDVLEMLYYVDKEFGVNLYTESTNLKTIEFRYPSSQLLQDPERIIENIIYFQDLVSLAQQVNFCILAYKKELIVYTLISNKIHVLRLTTKTKLNQKQLEIINKFPEKNNILRALKFYGVS